MTHEQQDIANLAQLPCSMHLSEQVSHSRKKEGTVRKRQRTEYFYHGHRICRDTFRYIHAIGQDKLNAPMKHYKENGITRRLHGNTKRLPSNTLKTKNHVYVNQFILDCAETYSMHLPGRVPGYWRADLKLLPTDYKKRKVYDAYCTAIGLTALRAVSIVTFRRLW